MKKIIKHSNNIYNKALEKISRLKGYERRKALKGLLKSLPRNDKLSSSIREVIYKLYY